MNTKEKTTITLNKSCSEQEDMISYCLKLLESSPPETPEHKIAQLALIQLRNEQDEIVSLCEEIQKNAPVESVQHKITDMVLNQYKNIENNQKSILIPDGWQLVPKDPTPYEYEMFRFVPAMAKMKVNQDEYDRSGLNQNNATWIYQNMLKYAPKFNSNEN